MQSLDALSAACRGDIPRRKRTDEADDLVFASFEAVLGESTGSCRERRGLLLGGILTI